MTLLVQLLIINNYPPVTLHKTFLCCFWNVQFNLTTFTVLWLLLYFDYWRRLASQRAGGYAWGHTNRLAKPIHLCRRCWFFIWLSFSYFDSSAPHSIHHLVGKCVDSHDAAVWWGLVHLGAELQASEANNPFQALRRQSEEMAASWPKSPASKSSPSFFVIHTLCLTTERETTMYGLRVGIIGQSVSVISSLYMLGNKILMFCRNRQHFDGGYRYSVRVTSRIVITKVCEVISLWNYVIT